MSNGAALSDAKMIAPDQDFDGAPLLRREVEIDSQHGAPIAARLRASALGIVELQINGAPVGNDVLSPGWTSYQWRLRYRDYDVLPLLPNPGGRAMIGASLGNGWYRGRLGFSGMDRIYGSELGLIAELEITFEDGAVQRVVTDESWTAGPSETTRNEIYDGQTIDARRLDPDWSLPGSSSDGWSGVHEIDVDRSTLTEAIGPAVVRHESLHPRDLIISPSGAKILDFGQNLVGWLRFEVQGPAGTEITVKHAEVLEDGEMCMRILRSAQQTDSFILSGGLDIFEPTKTFHGFRYVQIDGWPGDLDPAVFEAVVVSSDLERIGTFDCSNELVNALHRNVVWGQRGNFVDVPTDCPQRDERLGWTGDISAFVPTAAFLFDVRDFLADWLLDLRAEQLADGGRVPNVVPDVLKLDPSTPEAKDGQPVTAIWGDAAVWVPWALYEAYGSEEILRAQYDSMWAHIDGIDACLSESGVWDQGFQFGDWLDPDAPAWDSAAAKADKGVVATACAFHSVDLVSRAAEVLGDREGQERAAARAADLLEAFHREYVHPDGTIVSDCATVYSLALHYGMLDGEKRVAAGDRLAELVVQAEYRVSTGFAGTPLVTWALSESGHVDVAYRLLLETECPSWLYPVTMGATTIWERWNSMRPDGSINVSGMTSFNHYALGGVADWLHKVVAGIRPAQPGYREVRFEPRPGAGMDFAGATLRTPQGEVSCSWKRTGEEVFVTVRTPAGVPAIVALPTGEEHRHEGGDAEFRCRFPGAPEGAAGAIDGSRSS